MQINNSSKALPSLSSTPATRPASSDVSPASPSTLTAQVPAQVSPLKSDLFDKSTANLQKLIGLTDAAQTRAAADRAVFALTPKLQGARLVSPTDTARPMSVTLVMPRQNEAEFQSRLQQIQKTHTGYMTPQEIAQKYGAAPSSVAAVQQYAAEHGMTVQFDPASQSATLTGSVGQMNDAFGANLHDFEANGQSFRSPTSDPSLPPELAGKVRSVVGLDSVPLAKPQDRVLGNAQPAADGKSKSTGPQSYNPNDIAKLYDFPTNSAKGQTIGLIELGGGYKQSDLDTYFKGLGMATPNVSSVGVDGAKNAPGQDSGADGEVALDNEVAGAMAPGANIVNYFGPNTNAGFLDAIKAAVGDTKNKPSVLSISWGGPESSWTKQDMDAFSQEFENAAAEGITVTAAAGDNGSGDGAKGNNVDFPGSSPYVLDVGGTALHSSNGKITEEDVWNDNSRTSAGGGGVSTNVPVPTWQTGLESTTSNGKSTVLTGRGAPDVAFDGDPQTGYNVLVDGQRQVIGGTSAGAPAWAALIALANAANGTRAGDVHETFYNNPQAFNDIIKGNNGAFEATKGWDATTGLGSPDGKKIVDILAGQTQTKKDGVA